MTASHGQDRCCWVIRPLPTDDSPDPHYPGRAAAHDDVDVVLRQLAVRLPEPCYEHRCDSCGDVLGDDETDVLHWRYRPDAEDFAAVQDWTTDGTRWHCPACTELSDPDAELQAARRAGRHDQPLLGMAITRAARARRHSRFTPAAASALRSASGSGPGHSPIEHPGSRRAGAR